MDILCFAQVIDRKPPQSDVFFSGAQFLSPPEPAAGMLMIRPEDNRYGYPLLIGERQKVRCYIIKPAFIFFMICTARQNGGHYLVRCDVPCISSREPVSYTHLRAHETDSYLVCRL